MYYKISDVCSYFNISRQAVHKWIKKGKIKVVRNSTNGIRIEESEWNKIIKGERSNNKI